MYIVNKRIFRLYLSNNVFEIVVEVVFETIFSWKCIKIYFLFFKFIFNINISKRLKNTKNNLKIKNIYF